MLNSVYKGASLRPKRVAEHRVRLIPRPRFTDTIIQTTAGIVAAARAIIIKDPLTRVTHMCMAECARDRNALFRRPPIPLRII